MTANLPLDLVPDETGWRPLELSEARRRAEERVVAAYLAYGDEHVRLCNEDLMVPENRCLVAMARDVPPGDGEALAIRLSQLPDIGAVGGLPHVFALLDNAPNLHLLSWLMEEWEALVRRDALRVSLEEALVAVHAPGALRPLSPPSPALLRAVAAVDAYRVAAAPTDFALLLGEASRIGIATALAAILDVHGNPGKDAVSARRTRP